MGRRFPSNPGKTLCGECDYKVIRHKINQICRVSNDSYFRLQKVDFDTPYIRLKIDFLVELFTLVFHDSSRLLFKMTSRRGLVK